MQYYATFYNVILGDLVNHLVKLYSNDIMPLLKIKIFIQNSNTDIMLLVLISKTNPLITKRCGKKLIKKNYKKNVNRTIWFINIIFGLEIPMQFGVLELAAGLFF
uniref:Uncharacterized protein n=1 Tax=Rhizophagus irregularis (strain DAOM 181602 / DAOM 197198 / MUCL 43194) TaxID=747089 RepID=U9TY94_RHIID